MKTRVHVVLLASVSLFVTLPLIGCSGSNPPPPVITVSVSPTTASLTAGGTQQFTATVTGASSTAVTWSCTGASCGTITAAGTYTAPASIPSAATVTVVATLQSDNTKTASAVVHHTPLLQAGDYAFVFNGWEQASPTPGRQSIVGRFHADAGGNITNGIEDINTASGVALSVPFTGTYTVGSDRRGTFTVTTTSGTATYAMVTDSTGTKANFVRFDTPTPALPVSGSGYFEAQDTSALSQASVAGSYALSLTAKPSEFLNMVAVGRVTVDAAGAFSGGLLDVGGGAGGASNVALTGSMSAPSSATGRGTAVLAADFQPGLAFPDNMNFVYYVVSANKLLLLQTDIRGAAVTDFSGEVRRQAGTFSASSFNAPVIFRAEGMDQFNQFAAIGRISPDGNGTLAGIRDQNFGSAVTLNSSFTGTYAVDSSGRSTMTLGGTDAIAYLFDHNQGYLLLLDTGVYVTSGSFKPQASGPFSSTSLASTYRHGEPDAVSMFAECDLGTHTFTSSGTFSGSQAYTFFTLSSSTYTYVAASQSISGTYTIEASGRGVMTVSSWPLVFWMVSADEIVALDTASTVDSLPVLLQYLK